MIDGLPLSFFLPLVVHVLAGLLIPLLNQLRQLTFWVLPSLVSFPFMVLSLSRFAPKLAVPAKRPSLERKEEVI